MARFLKILFWAIIVFLFGYFRYFVFLQINNELYNQLHQVNTPIHNFMQWIKKFDYWTLYYLKWVLTVVFTALFAMLSIKVLNVFFPEKKKTTVSFILLIYTLLTIISGLFFIGGNLLNHSQDGYILARRIIGILQSPAILMLIGAGYFFIDRKT